jgi:hypothetical protein
VVACLLRGKFAYRWEDTERIACQHDDVTGLSLHHAWDLGIRNVFNRVGATGVLRNGNIVIVRGTHCGVLHDILQDGSGVYLGLWMSHLVLSLMPGKILAFVELFGYKGDRALGLELLERAGGWGDGSNVVDKGQFR